MIFGGKLKRNPSRFCRQTSLFCSMRPARQSIWWRRPYAAGIVREGLRLEMALEHMQRLDEAAGSNLQRVVMLHFPPVNDKFAYNEMIELMQQYRVRRCFYGHLHGHKSAYALQGERWGIDFALVSTDYLAHTPRLIAQ